MKYHRFEKYKKSFCLELNTGDSHKGFLYIDDNDIKVKLYSFDKEIDIDTDNQVFLRDENCCTISLHNNYGYSKLVGGGPGNSSYSTYKCCITSNIAIVGLDKWVKSDKIKTVTFFVRNSDEILYHIDKHIEINSRNFSDNISNNYELMSSVLKELSINIRYTYSGTFKYGVETINNVKPVIEIEYQEEKNIFTYISYISDFVKFLSFSSGVHMNPMDISISKITRDKINKSPPENFYVQNFDIHHIWTKSDDEQDTPTMSQSLITMQNNDELYAFEKCLIVWMERFAEWRESNALMMQSLRLKHEISVDRLINAYRWFEEIPLTKTLNSIIDEDINTIADVASDTAQKLGYGDIKSRVFGALKILKAETAKDRFTRLVETVRNDFGETILDEKIIDHLMNARKYRGESAHGYFDIENNDQYYAFAKSIKALEALCFLLTACDLPISTAGLKRAENHYFIQSYRHSTTSNS